MFSSLKVKLQQILNPFQRRSASICVQSKAKKIESKRDVSLTKINVPVQIDFTPKKISNGNILQRRYDELETISKQTIPIQANNMTMTTRVIDNRNIDREMYVSDIESGVCDSDRLLLPSLDDGNQDGIKDGNKMRSQSRKASKNSCEQNRREKVRVIARSQTLPEEQTAPEVHVEVATIRQKQPEKENTLINWLQQNKPQYFMIKLNKTQLSNSHQLKQKRLQQYTNSTKQQAKTSHNRNNCMICEQLAPIKQSIQLACTHRLHKICAEIIKWKPRMKCNVCERKSVTGFNVINNSDKEKIKEQRRRFSQIKNKNQGKIQGKGL